MDVARAPDGTLALRGWDGTEGTVALLSPEGDIVWTRPCGCPLGTGLAVDSQRVYAADPLTRRVVALDRTDGRLTGELRPNDVLLGWPVDIASTGDGRLVAIDPIGKVTSWRWDDADPTLETSWRLRGGGTSVALAASTRHVAAALADGGIERWTLGGDPAGRWSLPDAELVDIALDDGDNPALLDAAAPRIVTLDARALAPRPSDGTDEGGPCTVTTDKVVEPTSVRLGAEATLTLTLQGYCPDAGLQAADVMLVWDPTSTYWYDYAYARATEAVAELLRALDAPGIRVGLVASTGPMPSETVLFPLTDDPSALETAAADVVRYDVEALRTEGTVWPDLLGIASEHLGAESSNDRLQAIVVVGQAGWGYSEAWDRSAAAFHARDGLLLSLLLPRGYAPGTLPAPWSDADVIHGVHAGSTAQVARRIQGALAPGTIRDVWIDDDLAAEVGYVADSATPPIAAAEGKRLSWDVGDLGTSPVALAYRVTGDVLGRHATSTDAFVHFTDADGTRRRVPFPRPVIEVLAPPSPTAVASRAPTPTAPPTTAAPSLTPPPPAAPIYLPLALAQTCALVTRRLDLALVVDASTSMLAPAAPDDPRSKLAVAQAAARTLVDALDLAAGDRVAIAAFNADATLRIGLSSDRAALGAAVDAIEAAPGTCLRCGLAAARGALDGTPGGSAAHRVRAVILLTDGRSDPEPPSTAIAEAAAAKAEGLIVHAIGLGTGTDLDEDALRQIASTPAAYHHAPSAAELAAIYLGIAQALACGSP